TYAKALTIGSGTEWRFRPLAVDLNRDGHLDLVATARLAKPALQRWLGDGKGNFTPTTPTWTDIGYAALATGDINGDGFPDIVAADLNHDGHLDLVAAFQRRGAYTYYGDGRGGFTGGPVDFYSETREFQSLAVGDVNKDGHPDLAINGTVAGRGQPNGPDVYL